MSMQKWIGGGVLALTLITAGCRPSEDWTNPKWIAYAMKNGHEKAMSAYSALPDAEKLELLPTVIDTYNANLFQRDALRALQTIDDSRVIPVFRNALHKTDDDLALLGARGLAARGERDAAAEIAERLRSATAPGVFLGMVESIETLDASAGAGVMTSLLQRPNEKIGGVPVVKAGCRILGDVPRADEDIVQALVLGMVNFSAMPYVDPMPECEAAALKHIDAVEPAIAELYLGKNDRANELVRGQGFSDAPARLRGAIVMSHLRNETLNASYRNFLSSRYRIPDAEFDGMTTDQQMAYYDNMGQLFEVSVKGLSYSRNPSDRALVRSLVDPEGGLKNFSELTRLGTTGEVGYRQAAATALVAYGDASDKAFLWNEATRATVSRGGSQGATLYHLNVIHALGRVAAAGDLAKFRAAFAAQPEQWRHEFRGQFAYFALGEACNGDLECLKQAAIEPSRILDRADVKAWIAEEKEERREMLQRHLTLAVQSGAVWQMAMLKGDHAAAEAILDVLDADADGAIGVAAETLLYCRGLNRESGARIRAWLEGPASPKGGAGVAEMRNLMTVIATLAER